MGSNYVRNFFVVLLTSKNVPLTVRKNRQLTLLLWS